MKPRDVALALLVVALWGINYVFIKAGLHGISPFVLGALRLGFTAFPALLFIRPPRVPLRVYAGFAAFTFVGQFSFLFLAIKIGMPSGLASVVQQAQVFLTILLAWVVFRERPRPAQIIGTFIAAVGLVWLAADRGGVVPLAGVVLTLLCALAWAIGNLVSRSLSRYDVDVLSFVVWAALLGVAPFFALAALIDGPRAIVASFRAMNALSWISVAYLSFGATLGGFGLWNRLLRAYPAAQVTRFALLLPVLALVAGWIVFDERLSAGQIAGSALVVLGVALPFATNLGDLTRRRSARPDRLP